MSSALKLVQYWKSLYIWSAGGDELPFKEELPSIYFNCTHLFWHKRYKTKIETSEVNEVMGSEEVKKEIVKQMEVMVMTIDGGS